MCAELSVVPGTLLAVSKVPDFAFDVPIRIKTIKLGVTDSRPPTKQILSCRTYPSFMVKQIDLGEKGAEQLSIIPNAQGRNIECTRENRQDEIVIKAEDWSGYFRGVKGDLVFFNADDLNSEGLGIAIVNGRTGQKIFVDSLEDGAPKAIEPISGGIRLKYRSGTMAEDQCSIPEKAKVVGTPSGIKRIFPISARQIARRPTEGLPTD